MKKKGVTLLELVIVIILTGIVGSVLALVITSGMDSWVFMRGQKRLALQGESALSRMVREIRRTKNNTSITNLSSAEYTFIDIDDNTIDYKKSGTNLLRNNEVLLEKLAGSDGLNFVYLNNAGGETSSTTEVRTVQADLILQDGGNRIKLRGSSGIKNQ